MVQASIEPGLSARKAELMLTTPQDHDYKPKVIGQDVGLEKILNINFGCIIGMIS